MDKRLFEALNPSIRGGLQNELSPSDLQKLLSDLGVVGVALYDMIEGTEDIDSAFDKLECTGVCMDNYLEVAEDNLSLYF